ncbi:MAG: nitroreductase family protein [Lachnospiraceae bacterium]|nr:nitroreductase family protein [Lachnospiraceae bacterium]
METITCLKTRRSIRKYKEEKDPRSLVEEIFEIARYAPTWKNSQTPGYVVVDSPELKEEIAEHGVMGHANNARMIRTAPALIILTYETGICGYNADGSFSTSRGAAWESFDAGIACQTFCLTAWEKGLGTCIMGIFEEAEVAKIVELPEGRRIAALIALGYPDEEPKVRPRKDVGDLLSFR